MHNHGPHAHGFHKDDIDQQMSNRIEVFQQAAAQFDDRCLAAKATNPAHSFDQSVRFGNRIIYYQRTAPIVSSCLGKNERVMLPKQAQKCQRRKTFAKCTAQWHASGPVARASSSRFVRSNTRIRPATTDLVAHFRHP